MKFYTFEKMYTSTNCKQEQIECVNTRSLCMWVRNPATCTLCLYLHVHTFTFTYKCMHNYLFSLFSASEVAAIHLSHISAATVSGKVIMIVFLVVFSHNVPN